MKFSFSFNISNFHQINNAYYLLFVEYFFDGDFLRIVSPSVDIYIYT